MLKRTGHQKSGLFNRSCKWGFSKDVESLKKLILKNLNQLLLQEKNFIIDFIVLFFACA
jgi:hypothetical protein